MMEVVVRLLDDMFFLTFYFLMPHQYHLHYVYIEHNRVIEYDNLIINFFLLDNQFKKPYDEKHSSMVSCFTCIR